MTLADQPPAWRSYHYVIIPHAHEPRVLLLDGAAGWSLPLVRLDERRWLTEVAHLRPALRRLLGLEATALRCAYALVDRAAGRTDAIFEMENHSPGWAPPQGGQWIGRAELAGLTLAQPEQAETIAGWLAERKCDIFPPQRPPWAYPGWLAAATAWIERHLARHGHALAGPIEQVKTWGISCVLRAPTPSGDAYFKAVPPLFAQEPAITQALAERYPDHIPTPLAIDRERSWMLLWDFGRDLRGNADIAVWEEALRRFSQIQRDSAGRVPELLAAGCVDRRLGVLAAQIDPLLDDAAEQGALGADEIARLRELAPRLREMCEQLATYGEPQALVHGDFHPGNIAFDTGRHIFFDWTDACIAHPFLDMVTVLDLGDALGDVPDARTRLRDAYLAAWASGEPAEKLAEAFELGVTLGALHQAVSYRNIVATLEPTSRQELDWGVPYWLRLVLSRM